MISITMYNKCCLVKVDAGEVQVGMRKFGKGSLVWFYIYNIMGKGEHFFYNRKKIR